MSYEVIEYEPDHTKRRQHRRRRMQKILDSQWKKLPSGGELFFSLKSAEPGCADPMLHLAALITEIAELLTAGAKATGMAETYPEFFETCADSAMERAENAAGLTRTLSSDRRFIGGLFGDMRGGISLLLERVKTQMKPIEDCHIANIERARKRKLDDSFWNRQFSKADDGLSYDLSVAADKLRSAATDVGKAGSDSDDRKTADHFKTKYGISPDKLKHAVQDGRLKQSQKRHGRWYHSESEVARTFPDDVLE